MLTGRSFGLARLDPATLPREWVRILRAVAAIGTIGFAVLTFFCFMRADQAISAKVSDVMAIVNLAVFFFFLLLTIICGALSTMFGILTVRCWMLR